MSSSPGSVPPAFGISDKLGIDLIAAHCVRIAEFGVILFLRAGKTTHGSLTKIGRAIEIVVRPAPRSRREGKISVAVT